MQIDLLTFAGTTQTWLAEITILHGPPILKIVSTSTLTITSTHFLTQTQTTTLASPARATHSPSVIVAAQQKPVTMVVYKFVRTSVQLECLDLEQFHAARTDERMVNDAPELETRQSKNLDLLFGDDNSFRDTRQVNS